MKIFIVIGLMLGTLFAADFRGEGQLQTTGGNNLMAAVYGNKKSENATVHISYKYRLYTFMGEPVDILQAQWRISSVYFESLEGVKGKDLTYGICSGGEDDSCIPAAIMLKARIVDLDIAGVGKYGNRLYRHVFDAGAMQSPGLVSMYENKYVDMSFSTPGSPSWKKTFLRGSTGNNGYYDEKEAKKIMKQKRKSLFHAFHVESIVYNLGKIRHYIEKRAKDKQDAEDAKKKAEEEKLRLEKERLEAEAREAEARAREAAALEKEAEDAEAEYDRLMAEEKEANTQHVTTAQNKLRDVERKKAQEAQEAKKRRDARLAQLEQDRRDRAKKEAQRQRERQARAEIKKYKEKGSKLEKELENKKRRIITNEVVITQEKIVSSTVKNNNLSNQFNIKNTKWTIVERSGCYGTKRGVLTINNNDIHLQYKTKDGENYSSRQYDILSNPKKNCWILMGAKSWKYFPAVGKEKRYFKPVGKEKKYLLYDSSYKKAIIVPYSMGYEKAVKYLKSPSEHFVPMGSCK